ncbi:flagellar hook-length control protein FliK [Sporosarcina pasteurii]|uniref:Flagellar hook-length control protein FliK n=1 Tax=Sporosarcina pasteurii TaxID=1474 RepID=A0A380BG21_SPOPA|nr:flagellar hook-length control protein FliK [Sporosarcina pasteurii]MDS9470584.1 flagellar hook-length control protein FliK [Sporosarcina pasteurii]SUJ00813.1 Flagellar hook-length control protein FliK [Sporosarcina pasteurii]
MINAMVLPKPIHIGKMPVGNRTKLNGDVNEGAFGSVLATLTDNDSFIEIELSEDHTDTVDVKLSQLLQVTTIDELVEFLQENEQTSMELPFVIDEHLVFRDKKILDSLVDILPIPEQLEFVDRELGTNAIAIYIWQLIEQFDALGTDLFPTIGGKLSKEQSIGLLAVIKLITIEGPKADLTLKQEQQLSALQEIVKSLEMREKTTTHVSSQNNQFKESLHEMIGQSTLPLSAMNRMHGIHTELKARESSRAELLLRELQNVFKRSNLGQSGGTTRISIKMYPEHLGQLRIELLQTHGVLTARILASSALGKEMLESHLHQLRNAFLQQNIQVERIDISQMLNEASDYNREQAFGQQFQQEQESSNGQETEQSDEEHMTFEDYLIELEV